MSDPSPIVEARSSTLDWVEWVLVVLFFVLPTVLGWIRKLTRKETPEAEPGAFDEELEERPAAPGGRQTAHTMARPTTAPSASSFSRAHEPGTLPTVATVTGASGTESLLRELDLIPGLGRILSQSGAKLTGIGRASQGSSPWRWVGGIQAAAATVMARTPELRGEIYEALELPPEGINVSSLEELQAQPELLVASWTETLFADVLGLWIAGPIWARGRLASLMDAGAVSEMNWNIRSGVLALNPPAALMAPAFGLVLRQFGMSRDGQAVEDMAGRTGESLTLNILGLPRRISLRFPMDALVLETRSALRRVLTTEYSVLGDWKPSHQLEQRWLNSMKEAQRWAKRVEAGQLVREPGVVTTLGALWLLMSYGQVRAEELLTKASEKGPRRIAHGVRGVESFRGQGGLPSRGAMVESLLLGALLAPPVSRNRGRRSDQSAL